MEELRLRGSAQADCAMLTRACERAGQQASLHPAATSPPNLTLPWHATATRAPARATWWSGTDSRASTLRSGRPSSRESTHVSVAWACGRGWA